MLIIKQSTQKIIGATAIVCVMFASAGYLLYKSFNLGQLTSTQITIDGLEAMLSASDLKAIELDLKILDDPRFKELEQPLAEAGDYQMTKQDLFK
jgi:hypothetical protein